MACMHTKNYFKENSIDYWHLHAKDKKKPVFEDDDWTVVGTDILCGWLGGPFGIITGRVSFYLMSKHLEK